MSPLQFELSRELPSDLRDLIWQTFFVERQRGIVLSEHFPWMVKPSDGVLYASLRQNRGLVGGLAVKRLAGPGLSNGDFVAIGLVCVDSQLRGQGMASRLLEETLTRLKQLGTGAATLWTGKPGVYTRHGFELAEPAWFGQVSMLTMSAPGSGEFRLRRWPDSDELTTLQRGLPPFAHHAQRISSRDGRASAIVIYDAAGAALAEWHGDDDQVAALLRETMPAQWRMNAIQGDTLAKTLEGVGASTRLEASHLQMWKHFGSARRSPLPSLRLLDRI